jgi:hypothetical protein
LNVAAEKSLVKWQYNSPWSPKMGTDVKELFSVELFPRIKYNFH